MTERVVDMDVRNEGLPLSIVVVSGAAEESDQHMSVVGGKDVRRRRSGRQRGVGGSCVSVCSGNDTIPWGKMDDADEDDQHDKDDDCRSVNSCAQVSWLDSVGSSLGIGDATSEDCSMDSEDRDECYSQSDDEFDFVDEVDENSLNPHHRDDSVFDADEVALLNSCWDDSQEDEQGSACDDSGDEDKNTKPKTKNETGQKSIIMNRQKKIMTMMMIRNRNNQEVSDDDEEDDIGKEGGQRTVKSRMKRQSSSSPPSYRREKRARILPESGDVEMTESRASTVGANGSYDETKGTKYSKFGLDRVASRTPPQEITVSTSATTSTNHSEGNETGNLDNVTTRCAPMTTGKSVLMRRIAAKSGVTHPESDFRGLVEEHRYDDALQYLQRNPFASMKCDTSEFNVLSELLSATQKPGEKGEDQKIEQLVSAVLQRGGGHAILTDCNMSGESALHDLVVRGCACQTDEEVRATRRRNQLLKLVLDSYPHAVYQEKRRSPVSSTEMTNAAPVAPENGRTMLDDFATVWSTLTEQRIDDVTAEVSQGEANGEHETDGLAEENDGQQNGDEHSSDVGGDEADGSLHADLQQALNSPDINSKDGLSESLRVIFDRYEHLLRAAMKTTENREAVPFYCLGASPSCAPKTATVWVPRAIPSNDSSLLMCAVSSKTFVPESLLRLVVKFSKSSKGGSATNSVGQVPLAVLASNWTSWRNASKATGIAGQRSAVRVGGHFAAITEALPNSAAVKDREGRLPLHTALDGGMTWAEGVGVIFADHSKGISVRDPRTLLFPFMLAAMKSSSPESEDESDVDTAFQLLREDPTLVSSRSTSKQQLEDKIKRLEKEKEELRKLLQTLQATN